MGGKPRTSARGSCAVSNSGKNESASGQSSAPTRNTRPTTARTPVSRGRLRKQLREVSIHQAVLGVGLLPRGQKLGDPLRTIGLLDNGRGKAGRLVQQRNTVAVAAPLVINIQEGVPAVVRGRDRVEGHHVAVVRIREQ